MTDSGGVQEEAPIFHKPVLVLRKVTERPEASLLGMAKIVGTSREAIVREASRLLSNNSRTKPWLRASARMAMVVPQPESPLALSRWLEGEQPVLQDRNSFRAAGSKEQVAA